jgi:hypothetical protein
MKIDLSQFEGLDNGTIKDNLINKQKENLELMKKNNPLSGGGKKTIVEPSHAGTHAISVGQLQQTLKGINHQLTGQFVVGPPPQTMASTKTNVGGRKTKRTKRKTKTRKPKRKTKKAKRKTKRTKRKTKRTKRKTKRGCNCKNCKCACCLKKRKRRR